MKFKIFAVLLLLTFRADADIKTWPYPVEVFSRDAAFPVQSVLDGDTVKILYKRHAHARQTHRRGYARVGASDKARSSVRQRSIRIYPKFS